MADSGISIDIWGGAEQHIGRLGNPSRPMRVLGRASATAGVHSVSYALNGRGRFPTAIGPTAFRLQAAGDFCLEFDRGRLKPGQNTVRIWVVDGEGAEETMDVTIQATGGTRWPLPYTADWTEVERPVDACEFVDGRWDIREGKLRTIEPGYDRLIAIGDVAWRHYDVRVPFTVHDIDRSPVAKAWPSMGPAFGVQLRFEGHHNWGDILPARGWFPFGIMARLEHDEDLGDTHMRLRLRGPGFVKPLAEEPEGREVQPGSTYIFRVASASAPNGQGEYAVKVWREDEAEPEEWQLTARGLDGETPAGSALVMAHHVDASIGTVHAAPIG